MTGQITDSIEYKGETLGLYGSQGEGLFDPKDFDIAPDSISTACYRGYISNYAVTNESLILQDLQLYIGTNAKVLVKAGKAPKIKGKAPAYNNEDRCADYESLDLPVSFTGSIVCGGRHLRNLYHTNLRFLPMLYFCESVYELEFSRGSLTKVLNLSERFCEIREKSGGSKYCKKRTMPHNEIEKEIGALLNGSYKLAVFGL